MKTEVYSWRISPQLKRALEDAARREKLSVSRLLEHIVTGSLRNGTCGAEHEEAVLQQRLHAAATRSIGKIESGQTDRSRRVRQIVQRKLQRKRARARTH